MKNTKNAKKIRFLRILMAVCAVIFLVSGFVLVRDAVMTRRQQATFDELSEQFVMEEAPEAPPVGETAPAEAGEELDADQQWKTWWEEAALERFPVYQSMRQENPDMIGWIRIEGTKIDYPVMQTPASPDFYLHMDFHKKRSSYGTPYMDENCRYQDPRTSLLIYGHHMKNGSMFAALEGYTDAAFYREHPYVQFDTMEEAGSYEVAAAIRIDAAGDQTIWQDLLFPKEDGDFAGAWERVCSQRFFDTGVELTEEDELLALVTCEYTLADGRIMVIAKRIR